MLIFSEVYRSYDFFLCNSPASCYTFLGTNIPQHVADHLVPCYTLTVTDQVSHSYKAAQKITILYICFFMFLIVNGKAASKQSKSLC